MDIWSAESNPVRQTAASIALAVAGLVLTIAARDFGDIASNAGAGFLLGVGLLVLGIIGFLVSGPQTVVIDAGKRLIIVKDVNRLGTKTRVIHFGEITRVGIGYLGKKSNFVQWYYLILHLQDGKQYPLFAAGRYYEGASDQSTVEGWRRRLEAYLGQPPTV